MTRGRVTVWLLVSAVTLLQAAPELDVPETLPDEPLDLRAARFEYTNDTLMASGGVTGRFENVEVYADRISGNPETGDLHMEGDIRFERGNVIWQGSSLDYNYLTQTGNFGPSMLDFDPVLMEVDHVERVSTNEYYLRGAVFTTCPKEDRHFHVRAKEARLVDEKYLKAKGVTVYLGRVPIFYVPYWRQQLSRSIFTFRAGYGSEWGAYGLIRATVPLTQQVNALTDLNLYSDRGVGVGQGFTWDTPSAQGIISGFYLKDEDPYNRYDEPDERLLLDEDRYRVKFEHLQRFTDEHYVNTKWNYLSDPYVLDEFFEDEYRRHAQPENYASWVYGGKTVGNELFINDRLNDFYGNTDRVEYSFDLYRTKLGRTPLYLQSENTISRLDRVFSETNTVDTGYDAVRLDTLNGVYLPQRFGFLRVVPRATVRATYYSDIAIDDGEETRLIPGAGMEASFYATRVLSERERWYGTGLRHKIEPYVDYIFEDSSVPPSELLQFDGTDRLSDENKVKVGLRNVLQTKRKNRVSRFIELDLYTHYLVDDQGTDRTFDEFFIDARMPLTERTIVDVQGVCDFNTGTVPFFNTRFSHRQDEVRVSLEHLYRQDQESLWTPRFELFPEGAISFETFARYEERSDDLEEIGVGGYFSWCCMRYGLGYRFYDENEHRVMFSIGLSAFPEARLSSGM